MTDSINPEFQEADPTSINPNFKFTDPQISIPNNYQGIPTGTQRVSYQNAHEVGGQELNDHNQVPRGLSKPPSAMVNYKNNSLPTRGLEINPHFQQNEPILEPRNVQIRGDENNSRPAYNCPYLWVFYLILLVVEILFIILFACLFQFEKDIKENNNNETSKNELNDYHVFFNSVQVIFIIGLGLLHGYLKHHTWSSLAIELFVGVFGIQVGLLSVAFWEAVFDGFDENKANFTFRLLMKSELNSYTTMITISSLIGKLTMPQYLILSIFEGFCSAFNYALNIVQFQAIDDGGSLYIYCFGGFFGLAASFIMFCGEPSGQIQSWRKNHEGGSYNSSILGLLGTCVFIVFMPALNSCLGPLTKEDDGNNENNNNDYNEYNFRYRGFINTFFSLIGSSISSFACSSIYNCGRFKVNQVLFSTITGGVIVAGSCCIITDVYSSIIVGLIVGALSVFLFGIVNKCYNDNNLFDTLGSSNLFGIPGFLGGILTSIFIAAADDNLKDEVLFNSRTKQEQSGVEIGCAFATLAISLITGGIIGLILKVLPLGETSKYFVDSEHFDEESEPFPEYYRPQLPNGYKGYRGGNIELRQYN